MSSLCYVCRLGQLDYLLAWEMQQHLVQARTASAQPDTLLLLEHPHTYTLGSSGKMEHLLLDEAEREARGVTVHRVNRGGDITYHGPGQLVGYPIISLAATGTRLKTDVITYVRQLEQMLIKALADFGIVAEPLPGYTGVWVDVAEVLNKVAAIGVRVNAQRVTMHGFALNVNTDLSYFEGIIPCGIDDKPVTSMQAMLGHPLDMEQVQNSIEAAFGNVFRRQMVAVQPENLFNAYS
jgi:lipoyl(octanoyl) transferase